MGNVPSAEGSSNSRRATHKLSKPRANNPTTANLLSPIASVDSRKPSLATRSPTLSHGTSLAPSPITPPSEAGPDDQLEDQKTPPTELKSSRGRKLLRTLSYHAQFKSSSRPGRDGPTARSQSVQASGVKVERYEAAESSYNVNNVTAGLSRSASRVSVHYDLGSYEAKRLLNLVDDTNYEMKSTMSESHFQVSKTTWKSANPAHTTDNAGTPITRANSDISLYTPMRRRSLMTPGVATRPPIPPLPPKSRARFSLPTTPIRRDSLESLRMDVLDVPYYFDPPPMPRVVTPTEEKYQHTGAFRFGSLRITNGSPVATPTPDLDELRERRLQRNPDRGYFRQIDQATTTGDAQDDHTTNHGEHKSSWSTKPSDAAQGPNSLKHGELPSTLDSATREYSAPEYLPALQLSPVVMESSEVDVAELQTTSKHSALEDDLFDDAQPEYTYPEVLNIRVDPNAKSLPARPRLISERRASREINRSDSGIAASPISDHSHKPLTKADSGYSSNVSLRSFTAAKPPLPEKDASYVSGIDAPPATPPKDKTRPRLQKPTSPTVAMSAAATENFENNTIAPPVPEKNAPSPPGRPRTSQDFDFDILPTPDLFDSKRSAQALGSSPIPKMSARKAASGDYISGVPEVTPLHPTNSKTSASKMNSSSSSRRPGKLQRFLSNARRPMSANAASATDQSFIPPVPQELQARLTEHNRQFPVSIKRLALKAQPSRETLGTIFSVDSRDIPVDDVVPHLDALPEVPMKHSENKAETGYKPLSPLQSPGSGVEIGTASSVSIRIPLSQKAVARKPVPTRQPSQISAGPSPLVPNPVDDNSKAPVSALESIRRSLEGRVPSDPVVVIAKVPDTYIAPKPTQARTSVMMAQVATGPDSQSSTSVSPTDGSPVERPSSYFLAPPSQSRRPKTPPPVSMKTRNLGPLRQKSPSRSKSTPPGPVKVGSRAPMMRSMSRESIHSYPPAISGRPGIDALSRRSSRENIHSYPPALPHARTFEEITGVPDVPPMSPRRLQNRRSFTFTTGSGEHRRPNWEVQTDHDRAHAQQSSANKSRLGSLSSQSSEVQAGMVRLRPQRQSTAPPLRHRASHDGHSFMRLEQEAKVRDRDNGPYPPMPGQDGQGYVSDPWSGFPMPHMMDQQGRYPPLVPRTHGRNHSMDHYGKPTPYRVLHSYNSPAYKDVPIWG